MNFDIGFKSTILMKCSFDCSGGLSIGNHSVINSRCRIDPRGGIKIGNSVSISSDTTILTADHDIQSLRFTGRNRPVIIEDYVFIGTRAMILPGVTIHKGAVVAAGAIVTKDVEEYLIVAGIPAEQIGKRSTQLDYKVDYRRLFQ